MKRRSAIFLRMIIVGLVILASFLVYPLLPGQNIGAGSSVTADVDLLATVILCVSVSLWVTFADKEAKGWERLLLLVGLAGGSLLFWFLSWSFKVDLDVSPGWTQTNPTAAKNLSVSAEYMFIIGLILALAAIIVAKQNTKLKTQTNPRPLS
jgi:hypothetical protein